MEHLGTGKWPGGAVVDGWPREELVLNRRVALRQGGVGLVGGCEMWLDRGGSRGGGGWPDGENEEGGWSGGWIKWIGQDPEEQGDWVATAGRI